MDDPLELRKLIAIARPWVPLVIVVVLATGAVAFVVSNFQQKVYEAKATLIVGQALSATNPDYSQILVAQDLSSTYAAIAETRPILDRVIEGLGLGISSTELAERVRVDAPRDTTLLFVSAQDTDPARAAAIANELGNRLIDASPTIQGRAAEFQTSIDKDLAATQALIDASQARADALAAIPNRAAPQERELESLEGRLASLRATFAGLLSFSSGSATNLLTVVEPADLPTSPVWPRTLLNTLLAAGLGLMAAVGIAFVVVHLDDSIRDPDRVEQVAGLSTLGSVAVIPSAGGRREIYQLVSLLYPRSGPAETYRTLRVNIEFSSVDAPLHSLLVTSAAPGEGKTLTASNLAVAFAQAGRDVILVDADLRRPGAHLVFALPNAAGLTTLLRDESARLSSIAQPTEQANLRIVTTGPLPPNPAELLGSHRMQAVLATLRENADLVIFDSPPLQAVTDAAILSSFVDATVLVIDASRSRRRVVRLARDTLSRAGAHVIGAVLNRVRSQPHYGYGAFYEPAADAGGLGVDVTSAAMPRSRSAARPSPDPADDQLVRDAPASTPAKRSRISPRL